MIAASNEGKSRMDGTEVDLAIIGGGINGVGIARDAAGRGWSVFLCEQDDLASGTSSASTKLIHGGLRYLEYYEFRLVRESLAEREVLWGIAPHIIRPLRFVLPYRPGLRPAWMLRAGLFLYDHLGGRKRLPGTRVLDLARDEAGAPLAPPLGRGFEYSDGWVDDARLVVLNARDAATRGATIAPRTRCLAAVREGAGWRLTLRDETSGARREITARALVNAAGPWVDSVARDVVGDAVRPALRLVQGSHIVVPRLYAHDRCYIFQGADQRIFFAIPYEGDFTLIGTTDLDYRGDPGEVRASEAEVRYLCEGASRYFRAPVRPEQVVWSYSGVRPLYGAAGGAAQDATRDYVLRLDAPPASGAALHIYGGKITTYRRLAEAALRKLAPLLPASGGLKPGWTGTTALPGGDFAIESRGAVRADLGRRFPFLAAPVLDRLMRSYGTLSEAVLGGARAPADLGRDFGGGLSEAELDYLVRHEWARTAEDVLWRRSKLGLHLSPEQANSVAEALS